MIQLYYSWVYAQRTSNPSLSISNHHCCCAHNSQEIKKILDNYQEMNEY